MTAYELIMSSPLQTIRSGLCKNKNTGELLRFCQNKPEMDRGFAMMFPLKQIDVISIADADCFIAGMPFGSKFIKPLHGGLFDMSGFEVLSIDK